MGSRHLELQGPRPTPLMVSTNSKTATKRKKPSPGNRTGRRDPVIVYLISPKIIHVQPEEFMGLVQRLTGNNEGVRPGSMARVASHHHHHHQSCSDSSSSTCCLMSESSQEKLSDKRVDHHHVPSGIPTTTTATSTFAQIF